MFKQASNAGGHIVVITFWMKQIKWNVYWKKYNLCTTQSVFVFICSQYYIFCMLHVLSIFGSNLSGIRENAQMFNCLHNLPCMIYFINIVEGKWLDLLIRYRYNEVNIINSSFCYHKHIVCKLIKKIKTNRTDLKVEYILSSFLRNVI